MVISKYYSKKRIKILKIRELQTPFTSCTFLLPFFFFFPPKIRKSCAKFVKYHCFPTYTNLFDEQSDNFKLNMISQKA